MRPDLIVRRQSAATDSSWVIKDPVSLRYFNLSAQEHAILNWLDGNSSLEDIRRKFDDAFPPFRVTARRLQAFLTNLYENGLLIVDGPGQAKLLLESQSRQRNRERWQMLFSWLAVRFRGIDPEAFLSWLSPKMRWYFSAGYIAFAIGLVVTALLLFATHAEHFSSQLPRIHELISPHNLLWMAVAFGVVKVLHEFGHALACKHYGGECHEMGLMLLIFVPCLYCNVTDSWMLQSRWQRIVVSAAGILVELQLAALAVICWWLFQPGLLQTIALNTVVVCSVGTLVFNGNPLMRYDGYFILADLVRVPNLWQESRTALRRMFAKWFMRPDAVANLPPMEKSRLLATYGIASVIYRISVVIAILIFFHKALVPRGLGLLVPVVIASFVVGASFSWFGAVKRFWNRPSAWRMFNMSRVFLALGAAGAGAFALLLVPFSYHVSAPVMLEPVGAHRIYVSTPGVLQECVFPGDHVEQNHILARLEDLELTRDITRLRGEVALAGTRVQNLLARTTNEPEVAAQLQVAQEMLADAEMQMNQRQQDADRLVLKSPAAGQVMEAPRINEVAAEDDRLPMWTGSPMEPKNARCYLQRGALVCLVGDPAAKVANVFVEEADVSFIKTGQTVRLKFNIAPDNILSGQVEEVAKRNIDTVPIELAAERDLAIRPDATGALRPLRATYSVRVAIDEHNADLLTGALGQAKILVEPQSFAQRMLHALRRTLNVKW